MAVVIPLALLVIVLFTIGLFVWANRAGVPPLALTSGIFLAAGVVLGIYALTEAHGRVNAEELTSAVLAAGLLVSGALLAIAARRSPPR